MQDTHIRLLPLINSIYSACDIHLLTLTGQRSGGIGGCLSVKLTLFKKVMWFFLITTVHNLDYRLC